MTNNPVLAAKVVIQFMGKLAKFIGSVALIGALGAGGKYAYENTAVVYKGNVDGDDVIVRVYRNRTVLEVLKKHDASKRAVMEDYGSDGSVDRMTVYEDGKAETRENIPPLMGSFANKQRIWGGRNWVSIFPHW